MKKITITHRIKAGEWLRGIFKLPSSKSISNRFLMIRALSGGNFEIGNLSEAEDTKILQSALEKIMIDSNRSVIDVEDAGTAFRFLCAFLCVQEGKTLTLTGSERMKQRPIAELVDALRSVGAEINYPGEEGLPPLEISGKKLKGGYISIDGSVSSQFISALCLVASVMENGLMIEILNETVSEPYIKMTLDLMRESGVDHQKIGQQIIIAPQQYRCRDHWVENDWSSAAFFYAMAMVWDQSEFFLPGLKANSIQGDSYIAKLAETFGISTSYKEEGLLLESKGVVIQVEPIVIDLSAYPDIAPALMVACAIRYPMVRFSGLSHLQYKESDRLQALKTELLKADILLDIDEGRVNINNTTYLPSPRILEFNTWNDHRIAMALSLFALEGFEVVLDDGDCVKKSFPGYWEELGGMGFEIG